MSALDQLVRLHGWTLEGQRRRLAELNELADRLRGDLAELERELASEAALARESAEARRAFPAYARAVARRRLNVFASIAGVEREIVRAQDDVNEAYQELKKYELARSHRESRRREGLRRREQAEGDAVGVEMYRRR